MTPLEKRARELCEADGKDPNKMYRLRVALTTLPNGDTMYEPYYTWENYTDKAKEEIERDQK